MNEAYAALAALLGGGADTDGGGAPGGWRFGEVTAAGGGKLQVACNGLVLGPGDLRLPPGLDYTWTEDNGGANLLRPGDRLIVLVTADGQDYYVLQKAVWQ